MPSLAGARSESFPSYERHTQLQDVCPSLKLLWLLNRLPCHELLCCCVAPMRTFPSKIEQQEASAADTWSRAIERLKVEEKEEEEDGDRK